MFYTDVLNISPLYIINRSIFHTLPKRVKAEYINTFFIFANIFFAIFKEHTLTYFDCIFERDSENIMQKRVQQTPFYQNLQNSLIARRKFSRENAKEYTEPTQFKTEANSVLCSITHSSIIQTGTKSNEYVTQHNIRLNQKMFSYD